MPRARCDLIGLTIGPFGSIIRNIATKERYMDIIIGIAIGILAVVAVPAFFILKWFISDLIGTKGGRGFH